MLEHVFFCYPGTVMTPNYLRSPKISVSPFCDCSSSGNSKEECDRFTEFFTDNTCLRELLLWLSLLLSKVKSEAHSLIYM